MILRFIWFVVVCDCNWRCCGVRFETVGCVDLLICSEVLVFDVGIDRILLKFGTFGDFSCWGWVF